MRAGFAKLAITPDLAHEAVFNLGYWNQRSIRFTGVRDPIFVRCAALGSGADRLFMVAVDSIFDSYGFSPRAATRLAREHGVAPERIWITCSHSHSTPLIGLNKTECGRAYGSQIEDAIVAAAQAAVRSQVAVEASLHATRVPGVLYNRRPLLTSGRVAELHAALDPARITDPGLLNDTLTLIQFRAPDGTLVGAWCHFAIHGVCIQCAPEISGDCMGQAIQRLEAEQRGECVVLFTNGACGDVDPAAMGDAAALEQTASKLHQALHAAIRAPGKPVYFTPSSARAGIYRARRRATRSMEQLAQARAALGTATAAEREARHHSGAGYEYFLIGEEQAVASLPLEVDIPYQLWQFGELLWLGVAGEVFTKSGLELARALAPRQTFVIGYTGGWLGYFCPQESFAQGGYEVACASWSLLAPGEAERLFAHLVAEASLMQGRRLRRPRAPTSGAPTWP